MVILIVWLYMCGYILGQKHFVGSLQIGSIVNGNNLTVYVWLLGQNFL